MSNEASGENVVKLRSDLFRGGRRSPEPKSVFRRNKVEPRKPKPQDLPEKFQAKARGIVKSDPENGHLKLWRALELAPNGGNEDFDTQHSSLMSVCSLARWKCGLKNDPEDEQYQRFIHHFTTIYGRTHKDAENQVQMALDKIFSDDKESDYTRKKVRTPDFDTSKLKRHKRTTVEELAAMSPMGEPHVVCPAEFISKLFNPEVLDITSPKAKKPVMGFCAVARQIDHKALLFDPTQGKIFDPYSGEQVKNLDDFHFYSQAVFIKNSDDGGGRTNDNLAKRAYFVMECDIRNDDLQERFITFALLIAQSAPLVAVIDSGGKSLHFVFAVHDTPKSVLNNFMIQAALHGADRQILKTEGSWVRLPNVGASSEDRRPQTLIYYDPEKCNRLDAFEWSNDNLEQSLDEVDRVPLWFGDNSVYYELDNGSFIKVGQQVAIELIARSGLRSWKEEGEPNTPAMGWYLNRMETNSVKEVIKNLAGHHAGVITQFDGSQYLVRYSPKYPQPVKGKWEGIKKFLQELFDADEFHIFMSWLADGARCAYNNGSRSSKFGPSLFMNIVGEPNAGKTFLVENIIRPVLGGRDSEADGLFAMKDDIFNTMETGSELLFIDDTAKMQDTEPHRRHQGEVVKSICVSSGGAVHGKGVDKV